MDIAKDPHGASSIETDAAAGAGRIEADVKQLTAEIRESAVEDGIVIWKIYRGSGLNRQHVRREGLVFLDQTRVFAVGAGDRRAAGGRQPYHDA